MKLTIERSALAELMARGGSSAAKLSTVPVLNNVRLTARDGTLKAATTDTDLQAEAAAPADVVTPGAVTVGADALRQFVDKLPASATITVEWDGAILTVKSGRMRARLPTLPAADFPSLDAVKVNVEAVFTLTSADLASLFARTVPAACRDAIRYQLQGVFLHLAEGGLRAVATNGHILIMSGVAAPAGSETLPLHSDGRRGVIVGTATVDAILKLFRREEAVTLSVAKSRITVEAGDVKLVSKLVDATFPDHERIIPKPTPTRIILDRASTLSAVGLIEVFQTKDSGSAIECGEDPEGLALAAGGSADGGDGFAVAQAEFQGTPPVFGVSSKYLRTVLGAFAADVISLSIDSAATPIRFTSDHDVDVIGVVMPMRVRKGLVGEGAAR